MKTAAPLIVRSISELHKLLKLPPPKHPLVSVISLAEVPAGDPGEVQSIVYEFYSVCIKKDFAGKLKYGQQYYDFDEGVLSAFCPGQVTRVEGGPNEGLNGWWLLIHPQFLGSHALAKTIRDYGFFSYENAEALHLSEEEEAMLTGLVNAIRTEYSVVDAYSQDVLVSQIELLLNYCNRFYNRQFLTRKSAGGSLLQQVETILHAHFAGDSDILPTVKDLAGQLNVSPAYLSDMLRALTGQNAQQHIHNHLIEKAKNLLSTTALTINEIAYQLGFGYPQSFHKLFKSKTQVSPAAFRASFN